MSSGHFVLGDVVGAIYNKTQTREWETTGIPGNKSRTLVRNTLQTDVQFQDKMRVYIEEAQLEWDTMDLTKIPRRWDVLDLIDVPTRTFYENRLHLDTDGGLWQLAEITRQCSCCGHILASHGRNGKLLSCATCKTVHYCDRACQKRDWKQWHKSVCRPADDKQDIDAVMYICVRALTFMRLTSVIDDGSEILTILSPDVLSSMFLEKTDPRSQTYVDLANNEKPIDKNRVGHHFREKQECNRILFPIWETATDNLAFVPISMDFMSNGLGIPNALVESFKTKISANDKMYFVLVMGIVKGELAVVGGHSFIAVP